MNVPVQSICRPVSLIVVCCILIIIMINLNFMSMRWIYIILNNSSLLEAYNYTLKQRIHNVAIVQTNGSFIARINNFNLALENIRSELLSGPILDIPPNKSYITVLGTRSDIFEKLNPFSQVKTIWLEWKVDRNNTGNWNSKKDFSNVLLQNYYSITANDPLCTWIETPGMTKQRLDRSYNRTCNRNISTEAHSLSLLTLNIQKSQDSVFPNNITSPPEYVTYTHIIQNGLVSEIGEVFSGNMMLISNGCIMRVSGLPSKINDYPLFDEVFVISQYWGNSVFHRMVEVAPRLAIHLKFLERNKHIQIAGPEGKGGRLAEIIKMIGLDENRLHSGWCRAKVVYVPRGTACGSANAQEMQLLSLYYRNYIENNIPAQPRNRVVLIRRSRSRRFTEQTAIEQVVKSAARDFNLTYSLFIDNPVPSFNETMQLFKSAVMVVGPHGAGLSNIVFCEPGTVVIEGVCNRPHVNPCFLREAYVLGHRWHGIPSRGGCESVVDVAAAEIEKVVREYLMLLT